MGSLPHTKGGPLPCRARGRQNFSNRRSPPATAPPPSRQPCSLSAGYIRQPRRHPVDNLLHVLRSNRAGLQRLGEPGGEALCRRVRDALGAVAAEDLGLRPGHAAPCGSIGYQELYAGPDVTVCVFVLRAGAVIPLHDHPHMHVFGRLLLGRMHNRAFDAGPGPGITATLSEDEELIAPSSFGLGPVESQFHELTALEPCVFLDIITPSYNLDGGRSCNFYTIEDRTPDGSFRLAQTVPEGFRPELMRVYDGPAWEL